MQTLGDAEGVALAHNCLGVAYQRLAMATVQQQQEEDDNQGQISTLAQMNYEKVRAHSAPSIKFGGICRLGSRLGVCIPFVCLGWLLVYMGILSCRFVVLECSRHIHSFAHLGHHSSSPSARVSNVSTVVQSEGRYPPVAIQRTSVFAKHPHQSQELQHGTRAHVIF